MLKLYVVRFPDDTEGIVCCELSEAERLIVEKGWRLDLLGLAADRVPPGWVASNIRIAHPAACNILNTGPKGLDEPMAVRGGHSDRTSGR